MLPPADCNIVFPRKYRFDSYQGAQYTCAHWIDTVASTTSNEGIRPLMISRFHRYSIEPLERSQVSASSNPSEDIFAMYPSRVSFASGVATTAPSFMSMR